MRIQCGIAAVVLGLMPITARAQEEVKITGCVVDAAGKPVDAADVATFWNGRDGKMSPYEGTIANAEGRFTLAVTFRGRKQRLMAVDKNRKTGGFVWLEEKTAGRPVEIKLAPLVRAHGRILFKELDKRPPFVSLMIFSDSWPVLRCGSMDASVSFRLPPGEYRLRTYASGCESVVKTISLKSDALDVDLGNIDISASIITKHKGKSLPAWHVTDARGVKKDVKLSDFKGKWVLLEFWGYW